MADLPRVQRELALTQQPQTSVTPGAVAAPYQSIARGLGDIGTSLADYQRMTEAGIVAKENDAAKTAALNFENEANGDATAFQGMWDEYTKQRLDAVPQDQRNLVEQNFLSIGGDTTRRIMTTKFANDRATAVNSVNARIDSLTSDLTDLASTGDTSSPTYQAKHDELTGLINEKVGNPAWAYSPEQRDIDVAAIEDKVTGAAVSGELQRVYASQGYAAAQQRAQELYNDPKSPLSPVQKLKAINAGLSSVRALYEADSASRSQFSLNTQQVKSALADGSLDPDDPLVGSMLTQADALNDPADKLALQQAQAVARLNPMKGMGLHDRLQYLQGGATGGGSDLTSQSAAILRQEEGFGATAQWDVDAYRLGYGSDTITTADGKVVPVTQGATVTQADAERDLQRRLPDFIKVASGDIGADAWAKLPTNAQAALVSLTYNYGHVPASVVTAAQTGDVQKLADAVQSLPPASDDPKTAAALKARRGREAAIIRGGAIPQWAPGGAMAAAGTAPASAEPTDLAGYTRGVVPAVRDSIKDGLDTALTTYEGQIKPDTGLPVPLNEDQVNDLVDAARIVDDAGTYDRVATVIAESDAAASQLGTPVQDHAPLLDQMRAPGPAGDEAVRLKALDVATKTHNAIVDQLGKDPRGLGVSLGLFQPGPTIDWSNLQAAGQTLTQRGQEMARLENAEDQPANSLTVLRPQEADALKAAWQGGTVQQKQALVATLVQALPPDRLMAVLSTFAKDADARPLAVAGAISATNPDAGAAIIRGQAALATNPKFGFASTTDTDKTVSDSFPRTIMPPNGEYDQAWQDHVDAAKAVYADMSARAGDTSAAFNQDRWNQAITAVTGGVLNGPNGGGKVIAPIPGMSQQQFDQLWAKVSGAPAPTIPILQAPALPTQGEATLFKGAQWPDGSPLTANDVRDHGVLHSSGDGRYVVELGKGTGVIAQQRLQSDSVTNYVLVPFEIDLKKAATATEAPARVQDFVPPPAPAPASQPPTLPNVPLDTVDKVLDPVWEAIGNHADRDTVMNVLEQSMAKNGVTGADADNLRQMFTQIALPGAPAKGPQD